MRFGLTVHQVLPDVFHIQDALGVCCTLIKGSDAAVLLDAGQALYELAGLVDELTADLPLTVILSHGHYDRACGACQFDKVYVDSREITLCQHNTDQTHYAGVLSRARAVDALPDFFDEQRYLNTRSGRFAVLDRDTFHLGNLDVRVLRTPGHTPGSVCLMVDQLGLLLTGDSWNPQTWLFLPESTGLATYQKSMASLMTQRFEWALPSRSVALVPKARLVRFTQGLGDITPQHATPAPMPGYEAISTYACHPEPNSLLIFDSAKNTI